MNNHQAKELLERYLTGLCSAEESALVESWYLSLEENLIQESFDDLDEDLRQVHQVLLKRATVKKTKLWPRIISAAAVISVIATGWWFIHQQKQEVNKSDNVFVNDVLPGKNKAFLTLGDGSRIALDDAANTILSNQGSAKVVKTANGIIQYRTDSRSEKIFENVLHVPRGGQFQIVLVDGTKVWLNSGSSLSYPTSFNKAKIRKVKLTGEAYFEVFKDKNHPFVVESGQQIVNVLGTHFNINSYIDEGRIRTTLLEGSVRLESKNNHRLTQVLRPGQEGILEGNNLSLQQANIQDAVAWKVGEFRFDDEDIQSVMRKLARWYDIEVSYSGNKSTEKFNGKLSRYNNISQVLNALESTKAIHFKVEGRRVTVIQ